MFQRFYKSLFILLLLISFGCTKEPVDTLPITDEISTSELQIILQITSTSDIISDIAENQFETQKIIDSEIITKNNQDLPSCAKLSSNLINNNWTRTIDFGIQGCKIANGSILKGKINVSFSNLFDGPARNIDYSLEDFYVNDVLIEGNKYITYDYKTSNLLAADHPIAKHAFDLKFTFLNKKVYYQKGSRTRETIKGYEVGSSFNSKIYNFYGEQTLIFPNGAQFYSTTTAPIVLNLSCKMVFPVSGSLLFKRNQGTLLLDYGAGVCDELATITVKEITTELKLN